MTKRAIIVGSEGQDGKLLSNLLNKKNYILKKINRNNFDITNLAHVEDLVSNFQPHEIYYLAAFHHSAESITNNSYDIFNSSFKINSFGLLNVLETLSKFSNTCKVFYASSCHIFEPSSTLQDENNIFKPQSEYAISKVLGMDICNFYQLKKNIFVSIGILYNHESEHRSSSFLSKKISKTVAQIYHTGKGKLEISDMDSIVDWGWAKDYVDAFYRILQLHKPNTYIIATGIEHSVRDFVRIAFDSVGLDYKKFLIINNKKMIRKNSKRIGNSKKLFTDTSWKPSITFEKMVHFLVKEQIKNYNK